MRNEQELGSRGRSRSRKPKVVWAKRRDNYPMRISWCLKLVRGPAGGPDGPTSASAEGSIRRPFARQASAQVIHPTSIDDYLIDCRWRLRALFIYGPWTQHCQSARDWLHCATTVASAGRQSSTRGRLSWTWNANGDLAVARWTPIHANWPTSIHLATTTGR